MRLWRPQERKKQKVRWLFHHIVSRLTINKSLDRDLSDSLERIDLLEGENQVLLSSLRSLTASPFFQPTEHSDIVDLLSKVGSCSPKPAVHPPV